MFSTKLQRQPLWVKEQLLTFSRNKEGLNNGERFCYTTKAPARTQHHSLQHEHDSKDGNPLAEDQRMQDGTSIYTSARITSPKCSWYIILAHYSTTHRIICVNDPYNTEHTQLKMTSKIFRYRVKNTCSQYLHKNGWPLPLCKSIQNWCVVSPTIDGRMQKLIPNCLCY